MLELRHCCDQWCRGNKIKSDTQKGNTAKYEEQIETFNCGSLRDVRYDSKLGEISTKWNKLESETFKKISVRNDLKERSNLTLLVKVCI